MASKAGVAPPLPTSPPLQACSTRSPAAPTPEPATSEALFAAIRALRDGQDKLLETQREILAILSAQLPPGKEVAALPEPKPQEDVLLSSLGSVPRTRQRRKAVLVIDDDEKAREEARLALEAAHIPARTAPDGRSAIESIAADKPDVVILELAMGGSTAGQDVINMIKATMEWVHIPILLYTRAPIRSQTDAQTIHGADDLVTKGSDAAGALVAKVIQIFQRES